jgi:hypothetical protein
VTNISIHRVTNIIVKYDDYPPTNHGPSFTNMMLTISTIDSDQPHVINLYLPAGTRLPNIQETT